MNVPLNDLAGYEYLWANEDGLHDMHTPDYLENHGWEKYRQHPFWPKSWMMRRRTSGE